MAAIARDTITLTSLDDAFSVSLTPDSCVISADFDGSSPRLSNAFARIKVFRGGAYMPISVSISDKSNQGIGCQISSVGDLEAEVRITSLPDGVLGGYINMDVEVLGFDYHIPATFSFSVVRETSMLDWIVDWENNKTKIGSTYLITPKLFVGKKVGQSDFPNNLTGVYIGPDTETTSGLYGYKLGECVFRINAEGAGLGGWTINQNSISTVNGLDVVVIGSDGSIIHNRENATTGRPENIFSLGTDGTASFARGNVVFDADGNASFSGSIESSSGQIAGWNIGENALYKDGVYLDSLNNAIFVLSREKTGATSQDVEQIGGVRMFCESGRYGIDAYSEIDGTVQRIFSLGTESMIAGWRFDASKLWLGDREEPQIALGVDGISSKGWSLGGEDQYYNVRFENGWIGTTRFGENGLSSRYVYIRTGKSTLDTDTTSYGVFVSGADEIPKTHCNLDHIVSFGGFTSCVQVDNRTALPHHTTAIYSSMGGEMFLADITNGYGRLAGWHYNAGKIWSGNASASAASGEYINADGISLSPTKGIKGKHFRFEHDGSGGIAKDAIMWDKDGNLKFGKEIEDKFAETTTLSSGLFSGKSLYHNPSLRNETSGIHSSVYSDIMNGAITRSGSISVSYSQNPLRGGANVLLVRDSYWKQSGSAYIPYTAFIGLNERATEKYGKFLYRLWANIGEGWSLEIFEPQTGIGGSVQWLTPQDGIGDWAEYLCVVDYGKLDEDVELSQWCLRWNGEADLSAATVRININGTFQTTPVEWKIAYIDIVSLTQVSDRGWQTDEDGVYHGPIDGNEINNVNIGGWQDNGGGGLFSSVGSSTVSLRSQKQKIDYVSNVSSSVKAEAEFGHTGSYDSWGNEHLFRAVKKNGEAVIDRTDVSPGHITVISSGSSSVSNWGVYSSVRIGSTGGAAVYGKASGLYESKNWGGHFRQLQADGVSVSIRQTDESNDYATALKNTDTVICARGGTSVERLKLPQAPSVGQTIIITNPSSHKIYVYSALAPLSNRPITITKLNGTILSPQLNLSYGGFYMGEILPHTSLRLVCTSSNETVGSAAWCEF